MTASTTQMGATSVDPAFALGVLFAVAAGFFAIALNYYFRLTGAGERFFARRLRRRLRQASRFLVVRRIGRILWLIDVTLVVSFRAIGLIYLGIFWFIVVPLLMTIGSVALAASIVSF
jgi:hypothetical protein